MLTIKQILSQKENVIAGLGKKGVKEPQEVIERVLRCDTQRKELQTKRDNASFELNKIAKQIGSLFAKLSTSSLNEQEEIKREIDNLKSLSSSIKEQMLQYDTEMSRAEDEQSSILVTLPNVPYDIVPVGTSALDNVVVKVGNWAIPDILRPCNDFSISNNEAISLHKWQDEWDPKKDNISLAHWDLAKKYNLIDFDLGVKISGAGFPVYIGKGAQLQRALINFFLAKANQAGYTEIMPPTLVNEQSGYGTGQLPDKESQMYHCDLDNLYLIPTAEVPVTNLYRDVILEEAQLPICNCAYTQCFRREAGSYGKDVRGLNRLHEFSKVEIVRIDTPEHSASSHLAMLSHVESLLQALELPYRVLRLCGGDMSFTAALCYDFEVYSMAQHKWLEVSSTSNFDTFQTNRLKCRYRRAEDKKTVLCHSLNGSALALPRIVASLLENNQTPAGIKMPKSLVPYLGYDIID